MFEEIMSLKLWVKDALPDSVSEIPDLLGEENLGAKLDCISSTLQVAVNCSEEAKDDTVAYINKEKPPIKMYGRLLNLASGALAEKEFKQEKSDFWEEPYQQASVWKPYADRRTPNPEATPIDYVKKVLPLLVRNGIVHFLGFGNRLGFDPLPSGLQQAGALLVRRIRKYDSERSMLDKQLLGNFIPNFPSEHQNLARGLSSYLALHLRFEEDMVAYSQCDFGGGKDERKELQVYREIHFPLLMECLKISKPISLVELRKLGRCPLTPEGAALLLSGLGFKGGTYIYLAGSSIYGRKSRMHPFMSLYPNLVTIRIWSPRKHSLHRMNLKLLENFHLRKLLWVQMAALDFIACATADVFAMTDSGSQLSSLVSGFRTYYGGGHAPNLHPNKKRLAAILSENGPIGWNDFEDRVRKMIEEGQRA
ncbi:hypothetical protein LWI29_025173 [Acer saccharum]|uniref:O-fucosyltransferase family protein n=1 Tax=Acer saccharum TaxID=4024 RepID=A0AA39RR36_ACESA|nr:hypothetical protein LWI29_025173 [Acer saccharum]